MNNYVNDFNEGVVAYYNSLKKFKSKTKEEEQKLFRERGKDDAFVKREIINSNLKFVFDIAKRYKGYGVPLEDLISEGNIGLLRAYDKFDPSKDIKFFSYAVWWIRQSIQACIEENTKKTSFMSSNEESLNANVKTNNVYDNEDEAVQVSEIVMSNSSDMENLECNDEKKFFINNLLSRVDSRSRLILEMFYGIDRPKNKNLEEIGKELNLSKERVRQIAKKNIRYFKSKVLEEKYADVYV